ncbi:hypothetical protein PROFUN_03540 [Planoprotostelium fungivorum]|uniref:Autophagy-related protein 27 n=1 Tax=Planoprotostelium fungivorum TaxID=1890364 RepID=A0A2P6MSE1_9EUKA|nr:hypothetical protein PROFUN_03540 [Planoprotostelium fungivorum]
MKGIVFLFLTISALSSFAQQTPPCVNAVSPLLTGTWTDVAANNTYNLNNFKSTTGLSIPSSTLKKAGDPFVTVWNSNADASMAIISDICRQSLDQVGGAGKSQGDVQGFRIHAKAEQRFLQVDIDFICDFDTPLPGVGVSATEPTAASPGYHFVWKSIGACPVGEKRPPPPEDESHLGLGWILCIVFLSVLVAYFLIGIIVNKFVLKKESKEIIPNVHMWQSAGGLIKDGSKFTYRKVTRQDATYTAV